LFAGGAALYRQTGYDTAGIALMVCGVVILALLGFLDFLPIR
jgi:hypothetical protein